MLVFFFLQNTMAAASASRSAVLLDRFITPPSSFSSTVAWYNTPPFNASITPHEHWCDHARDVLMDTVRGALPLIADTGRGNQRKARGAPPTSPFRTLDAPGLSPAVGRQLMHWSPRNTIALGIGDTVFTWDGDAGDAASCVQLPRGSDVTCVSWSRSGRRLYTGCVGGHSAVWDAHREAVVWTDARGKDGVVTATWCDGALAIALEGGQVCTVDPRTPCTPRAVGQHKTSVPCMQWAPTGTHLATGDARGIVKVWDTRVPGAPVSSVQAHKGAVGALRWRRRAVHTLLSGGRDRDDARMRLWNTLRSECVGEVETCGGVTAAQWRGDEPHLVTAHGGTRPCVQTWSVKRASFESLGATRHHRGEVTGLQLSPDTRTMATTAGDELLCLWALKMPHQGEKSLQRTHDRPVPLQQAPTSTPASTVHSKTLQTWKPLMR